VARERFRRSLGGYDRSQVDAAIGARDARLARLEHEAKRLAERTLEKERDLQAALASLAAHGQPPPGAIGTLSRRLEEIHAQARRQATRMRMKALEDVVQMSDRVAELARLRDDLAARVQELAGIAGIRLGGDERGPARTEPVRALGTGMYEGEVEVEVGPMKDFAQLTALEDAAAAIDGASAITIRRFSGGRATLSMKLSEPVELLRELEQRAPFDFNVRATRHDSVVLDLDDDALDRREAA
jgi:hypothetical protein